MLPLDNVDSNIREDIGPRTVGRKGKAKQARDGKGRAPLEGEEDQESDSSNEGNEDAAVKKLPPEILSRILAHLDPVTLLQCTAVCRRFAAIAKDESTWRLAFALAFRIEHTGTPTTPILRRVDPSSWKAEYMRRTELLR